MLSIAPFEPGTLQAGAMLAGVATSTVWKRSPCAVSGSLAYANPSRSTDRPIGSAPACRSSRVTSSPSARSTGPSCA